MSSEEKNLSKSEQNLFGRSIVANGFATQEQVDECLQIQRVNPARPIGMIMIEMGYLRKDHLQALLDARASRKRKAPADDAADAKADQARQQNRASMEKMLVKTAEMKASDLHINVGSPAIMRLHGHLRNLSMPPFSAAQTKGLILSLMTEAQQAAFLEQKDLDFCHTIEDVGRFRGNAFHHQNGVDAAFRFIPTTIPGLEQLGIPTVIEKLTHYQQGLVLVTGPAGCGKTTTLAALVQAINNTRRDNIICLEEPIEFDIPSAKCNVVQRQIPDHSNSFGAALRAALREDPDVIMIGEMRDLDTISIAITAAETGHLVLGSLHTSSAARTVDRIIDVFPPKEHAQVRSMISESLRGVVSQQLIPRADGKGRVLAVEVLITTPAISHLIRNERTFQIPGLMQTGKRWGMQVMNDALQSLLEQGLITAEEAKQRSLKKAEIE